MDADTLLELVRGRYDGLVDHDTWGERALFYNPGGDLPRGTYFLTVKERDSDNDRASDLDRPGVYRVTLGLSKTTYCERFGTPPSRPGAGGVVDTGHDFTVLDELLPHPTYAWAGWVCVLAPSRETVETLWPLVDEAYERALATFGRRTCDRERAGTVGWNQPAS
jgi:hypothetical protein